MFGLVRFWLPLALTLAVAGVPLQRHYRMQAAEDAAADALGVVARAQEEFRGATGGYASALISLVTSCKGDDRSFLERDFAERLLSVHGYRVSLRLAVDARTLGMDCHGQPTVSDYFAAIEPDRVGNDGRKGFATTSNGRIYAFLDGVAPREADMAAGLALPLETLDSFKIP